MKHIRLYAIAWIIAAALPTMQASAQVECGSGALHELRLRRDSAYRGAFDRLRARLAQQRSQSGRQRMIVGAHDTTYEIPIVFHVMHTGGAIGTAFNPSDAQLIALADYVNKSFEATWPGYPDVNSGGVRTRLRFVLAKSDINCNPTNGITRTDASGLLGYTANGVNVVGSGGGATENVLRALSQWSPEDYLNIWIVNKFDAPGIAGFTTMPVISPSTDDYIIIVANVAQAGNNALVHEIGHAMGLFHTFEGGACPPASADCSTSGDLVCDTEPCMQASDCPTGINPCTGANYGGVQYNFMGYGSCPNRFTAGQRDLMLQTATTYWAGAAHSWRGKTPAIVKTACLPIVSGPTSWGGGGPLYVQFDSISFVSGSGYDDGMVEHLDNTCVYHTQVKAGSTYPLVVETGLFESVRAYIDFNNDGTFQEPAELVFHDTGSAAKRKHTGSIKIPATNVVKNNFLRLRIIADDAANTPGPCGPLESGQAEDYAVYIVNPTGIEQQISPQFTIYPNPVSGTVNFQFEKPFTGRIQLLDILGKSVISVSYSTSSTTTLSTDGLRPGVYLARVEDNAGGAATQRVCIMH